MRFLDQIAIVTGGGSGMGKETAARFVAEGGSVVINGRNAVRNLAIELAPDKIHVNAIAPAVIETPVYDTFLTPEQVKAVLPTFKAFHPLGRNDQVADVAEALLFLASDQAASSPASCCPSMAASWPAGSDHQPKHLIRDMKEGAMYYAAVSQCTQALRNLETWLDKAEQHAAAKKFDVGVLLSERLVPDMQPFIYQVQSACDYVKAAAAWLSGQTPPKHEDNEQTIEAVRARIRKTVAFAESVKEAQFADAAARRVSLSWAPGKVLGGKDYLLQMSIPNIYFHLAMAYAILRHNGVDIGKMDFLGPINWIDA